MITHARSGLRNLSFDPGPAPSSPRLMPIPSHFNPADAANLYPVDDQQLGPLAREWGAANHVPPASSDRWKVCVLVIDGQITFSWPDAPLFVSGDSGLGALEDTVRGARFIYQNAPYITEVHCTLDTHYRHPIFHQEFWVGPNGGMPDLYTLITPEDVRGGRWRVSESACWAMFRNMGVMPAMQRHAIEYTQGLADRGRYPCIIWPQHGRLGNVEHALMPMLYEAVEWHAAARGTDVVYSIKGSNNLFENYSAMSTEVAATSLMTPPDNSGFLEDLLKYDMVIAFGEAASHCFAWTIDDMLTHPLMVQDPGLARKFVIVTDCTSSVVIRDPATGQIIPAPPGGITDFRPLATQAFDRFQAAGMRLITSQTPIPDIVGYGSRS